MPKIQLSVTKDATQVRIGRDAEYACLSNPKGDIYDWQTMVIGVSAEGRRFEHQNLFKDEADADALIKRIEAAGGMCDLRFWHETHPVYGSAAWQQEDDARAENFRAAQAVGNMEAMERYS